MTRPESPWPKMVNIIPQDVKSLTLAYLTRAMVRAELIHCSFDIYSYTILIAGVRIWADKGFLPLVHEIGGGSLDVARGQAIDHAWKNLSELWGEQRGLDARRPGLTMLF